MTPFAIVRPWFCCVLSLACLGIGHARADIMWKDCIVPENMYVTKNDSKANFSKMMGSFEELDRQAEEMNMDLNYYGRDSWEVAKQRFLFNHPAPRVSFLAIMVDPHSKNISLMITSEHQKEDYDWVTDNQVFVDGKNNQYADFRCSGSVIQLSWNGRDYDGIDANQNSFLNEFFDSAEGKLTAKLESYINGETGQEFYLLRVAQMENSYPYSGLYGRFSKYNQSYGLGVSPYIHNLRHKYKPEDPGCDFGSPGCLMPMLKPGYDPIDRTRTNHDAAKLDYDEYETSSQNNLKDHLPVAIHTVRAHLSKIRTELRALSLRFSRNSFQGKGVHERINELDRAQRIVDDADMSMASGLREKGSDRDVHFKAAGDQLMELEALIGSNEDIAGNTSSSIGDVIGETYDAKVKIAIIKRMVATLDAARINAVLKRQPVNATEIKNSKIDSRIINVRQLNTLMGYENENEESDQRDEDDNSGDLPLEDDLQLEYAQQGDDEQGCLMTGKQIAHFIPKRVDNRFGFITGIEVRVSDTSSKPMVFLKSSRTPWTWFWQQSGRDYMIPEVDVWCRGALFGVDHVSRGMDTGVLRITVRGVYDNVRKEIYVGSMWSTWNEAWPMAYLQSALSFLTPIGTAAGSGLVAASVGSPLLGVTLAAANIVLAGLSPYAPPEVKFVQGQAVEHFLSKYMFMGDRYYNGSMNMTYYSTFGTLESNGNIR
ncbi:hypothetical protein [Parendozoicomonas sp. Alg238-R29]|uniref:hypothetical protein n=1 Tax=Parendozoicomonas sp. Alg238-R29 TaxID=2993446 RepID=UPI00248E60C5|nr:hypothetical protein [Parendozoicomonas sp. Alg238-R29]